MTIPRVFISSTLDLGQPVGGGPVHSPYKQKAGYRASAAVEALVYGQSTDYRGPRYAGAEVQGADVTISFDPASLYGAPLALNTTVSCPPTLCTGCCEDFAVQTAGSCQWFSASGGNVTAQLVGSGTQLRLSLLGDAATTGPIVATRGFFANWPLVQLYGGNGIPAEPWLANVTSGVGCAAPPPTAAWVEELRPGVPGAMH